MSSSFLVIFEVNLPAQLRRLLVGHEVTTAQEIGWATLIVVLSTNDWSELKNADEQAADAGEVIARIT